MEIQFLGTSSGTPTKTRNVAGLALRMAGARHWHLVDCGEGTQHRILHTALSLIGLRAIFITHIHGDHCYGLPGLLASAGMLNRTEPLFLVGPGAVRRFVDGVLASTSVELPFPLVHVDIEAAPSFTLLADVDVHATRLSHRVPSFAYTFTEKRIEARLDIARLRADGIPAGPAWGELQARRDVLLPGGRALRAADYLLVERAPRRIVVAGDNDTPALLAAEAARAHVLVHEATYTDAGLRKVGPGPQHSSAKLVAQAAQDAGLPNLVLTHFSPRYQASPGRGPSIGEIEAEARTHYGGRLFLADDLDRYGLDRQGVLSKIEPGSCATSMCVT